MQQQHRARQAEENSPVEPRFGHAIISNRVSNHLSE